MKKVDWAVVGVAVFTLVWGVVVIGGLFHLFASDHRLEGVRYDRAQGSWHAVNPK